MMKYRAIFGGTFDPVHYGHIALAEAAIEEAGLEELIFMPNYISPFKSKDNVTPAEQRCDMLELVIRRNAKFSLSRYELEKEGMSYTYDTLRDFRRKGERMCFVLGFDSLIAVETWHRGADILREYPLIAARRPGTDSMAGMKMIGAYRKRYGADITLLDVNTPDASATEIRKMIAEGVSTSSILPPEVKEYIDKNGLYRY